MESIKKQMLQLKNQTNKHCFFPFFYSKYPNSYIQYAETLIAVCGVEVNCYWLLSFYSLLNYTVDAKTLWL